jgi:hypothetical protein
MKWYVDTGSRPIEVYVGENSDRVLVTYESCSVWYDPIKDGRLISEEEAREKYPEYFV